jgi:hypothetical protein
MKVEIPDRVCPHCGGTTWDRQIKRNGYYYECSQKRKERCTAYRQSLGKDGRAVARIAARLYRQNPENKLKAKQYAADRYARNKSQYSEYGKKYRADNPDYKIRHNLKLKEERELLSDAGVMQYWRVFARSAGVCSDITLAQIEKYRTYLKTFREWQHVRKQLPVRS